MAGLYLHIPFCQRKCPYCDFFSIPAEEEAIRQYVILLTKHLTQVAQKGWNHTISTIYFGGGTPSLLSPQDISTILETIVKNFSLENVVEVSLEANPGTVSLASLTGYHRAGINRLSLGMQSCCDKQLQQLGRLHTRQEGLDAANWAREAGFDNLSLDLMFALPGQTLAGLEDEIDCFLGLQPEHLSCYGLTAEPGTPLHNHVEHGEVNLPGEDLYADAFMRIHDHLTGAGYNHYEIANYAREGFTCQHNQNYWRRQAYLGIGAGAHSFFPDQWGSRWQIPNDVDQYQELVLDGENPMHCIETFTHESAMRESVYLALRTREGISDAELSQHFGLSFKDAFPEAIAQNSQWLIEHGGSWSFTASGWLLFDRLILPFL